LLQRDYVFKPVVRQPKPACAPDRCIIDGVCTRKFLFAMIWAIDARFRIARLDRELDERGDVKSCFVAGVPTMAAQRHLPEFEEDLRKKCT